VEVNKQALRDAARAIGAEAAKLDKQLQRLDGLPPLDLALGLVQLDKLRRGVENVGKRLSSPDGNGKK
jgi:hypothetical protein